jgi:tRNA(fMet)-specific endonuclease VapC
LSLKYLLDATTLSEPLKPRPRRGILRKLSTHEDEIALSSIAWHELRNGCARLPLSPKREAIESYLLDVVSASFPILEYDRSAAEWHALERARLTASGKKPSFAAGQVAAIAYVNDLVLVSADRTQFKGFKGIRIQSWS